MKMLYLLYNKFCRFYFRINQHACEKRATTQKFTALLYLYFLTALLILLVYVIALFAVVFGINTRVMQEVIARGEAAS